MLKRLLGRRLFLRISAAIVVLVILGSLSLQAQTYTVIYNFTGGIDGAFLDAPLILDQAGNLYGEAVSGGTRNGTVFKLARKNSSWLFSPLYVFQGGQDGANPEGGLTFGPDGSLYGTTVFGGGQGGMLCNSQGCGTIFNLRPSPTFPRTIFQSWDETVLYRFTGRSDGGEPECKPAFDQAGNLYCTASTAGSGCSGSGCGTVYELTHSGSGWSFALIHDFAGGNDGYGPQGGLTIDQSGRLYGVTVLGGNGAGCGSDGCGTLYEFSPSGSDWTESILHAFGNGSGINPSPGVVVDESGNVYGATEYGQNGGMGGVVYELSPSGGGWTYSELYVLPGNSGVTNSLSMDSLGNLYGTTSGDGSSNYGSVFRLTPSGGGWSYSLLHEFTGGTDGQNPIARVVLNATGTLYGVTNMGGTYGYGLIFEITQ